MPRRRLPLTPAAAAIVAAQRALPGRGSSRRGISRRGLLGGAAAAALAAGLSGCSRGASTAGASPATDRSDTEPVLNWGSWPLFLDVDQVSQTNPSLQRFESTAQIRVTYEESIEDNQAFYTSIQAQLRDGADIGHDLIVIGDWLAAQLLQAGYAQRLNTANIPKWINLVPRLQNVAFDPGRAYSLPWQSGFTGIAWNKDTVKSPLRRVSDLWRPELRGGVQVLSEMRDTMGLIMLDQGTDISGDFGSDRFGTALEELERQLNSGQIRQATGGSYTDDLVSGDAVACMAWSGDIRQLNALHGDRWAFVLPSGGATLWTDNLLIPIGSRHKTNAEILMNYYYDPQVAAKVASYVQFICPVAGAQEQMAAFAFDTVLADDPLVFPSDDQLARASVFRQLSPVDQAQFQAQFEKVLGV